MFSPCRTAICAAIMVLASTGLASTARADEDAGRNRKLAVKLGVFFPTESNFRSAGSDVWFSAGLDYNPGLRYKPLGGTVHIGADAALSTDDPGVFNMWSLRGSIKWPLLPKSGNRLWGAFGGGGYFIHTANVTGLVVPGMRFSFGARLSERLFFEADYDYVSGFTDNAGVGQRADGVTLCVGYKL